MARRGRTFLDDLSMLPWWVNVILALVAYLSFTYWIPSITFQNPTYKGMATALPGIAPALSGLLLTRMSEAIPKIRRRARIST